MSVMVRISDLAQTSSDVGFVPGASFFWAGILVSLKIRNSPRAALQWCFCQSPRSREPAGRPQRIDEAAKRRRAESRSELALAVKKPLTRRPRHPYTIQTDVIWMAIMTENIHQLRPKPSDTEKITINLGFVDLGHIDLMVEDGFLLQPNRFHSNGNSKPTRTPCRRRQAVHRPKKSRPRPAEL